MSRLASLDPALPGLVDVLDPRAAAPLLTDASTGGGAGDQAGLTERLRRTGVQYRPGVSCVVTWEVRRREWTTPTGSRTPALRVLEARPDEVRGRPYTADPGLPGLAAAADPAAVLPRLQALLADGSTCSVTPVRYRAGSRCVLRYVIGTPAGHRTVFGKVLRGDVPALAVRLQGLAAAAASDPDLPVVPPVLGSLPDWGLLLQGEVGGEVLPVPGRGQDLAAIRAAGRRLAALHRTPVAGLPTHEPPHDLEAARDCVPAVAQASPALAGRIATALERLSETAPATGTATTHGALRTDQMRLDDGRLVLLDLDDLGAAPPERDLANLLAYLRWRALRRPALAPGLARARQALLAGYRDGGGAIDPGVHDWYEAVSLLKIAGRRHRRLDVCEWDLVPLLVDEAAGLVPRPARRSPQGAPSAPEPVPEPALDLERMSVLLAPLLTTPGRGVAPHERAEVLAGRVVEAKPGVRTVVRYELGGPAPRVVFGKIYAEPERAARLDRTLRLLGDLAGPRPLGWLSRPPLALYLPAPGDPLDELPADLALEAAAGLGRWLARLHGSGVRLERAVDSHAEVRDASTWARTAAAVYPELASPAQEAATRLRAAHRGLAPERPAPVHKDLHQRHVLVQPGPAGPGLSVIDFDEARTGGPSLDLAHLCANLDLLSGHGRPEASAWRTALLGEYARATGWRPGPAARFWYAHTCLKMAKQLATGRGPWPGLPEEERRDRARWALGAALERLP